LPNAIEKIYTDGACSGNPGPGGWGVVIYFDEGAVHELGGPDTHTTNNRMELQGAIAALDYLVKALPTLAQTSPVTLYTDSEYVKNGITKWLKGWKKKGWKTSAGKAVLNMDLWKELDQLNQSVQAVLPLHWQYVKGHSGDVGNDRTDAIATGFAQKHPPALRTLELENLSSHPESENDNSSSPSGHEPSSSDENSAKPTPSTEASAMNTPSSDDDHSSGTDSGRSRLDALRSLVETFHLADEIADEGYVLTSAEVANLVGISSSTVTGKGDDWIWRNWKFQRVQQDHHQTLWHLERIR